MPSKSGKQHRLMALVANDPKAAKRLGIPSKVGKKFMEADKRKGKKFASGGMSRPAALERRRQQEYLERNPQYREREEGLESAYPEEFLTPGGASKAAGMLGMAGRSTARKLKRKYERAKHGLGDAAEIAVIGGGGAAAAAGLNAALTQGWYKDQEQAAERRARAERERAKRERAEKAKKEKDEPSYRKGGTVGSASSRADGIAQRGKTRGKFI